MATKSLAPPNFKPTPVVPGGTWLQRHPTRYTFDSDVADQITRAVKAVEAMGFRGIVFNSYDDHPEGWSRKLHYNTSLRSVDFWYERRGNPIGHARGQAIVDFVISEDVAPYVAWCIWEGRIWTPETGRWLPWKDDGTGSHHDHPHFTFSPGGSPPKGEVPVPDVGSGVDKKALVALIDERLNGMGRVIVDEARRADLHVDLACALVEQESGGYNIFGADYGNVGDRPPFYRQPVTPERVQALRTGGSYRHGMNGVGLTQLTWWEFVERAEALGGAHLPWTQCRVGFGDLVSMLDVEGFGYLEALGAYNAGRGRYQIGIDNGYAGSVAERHRAWKQRISALPKASPKTPPGKPAEPSPKTPLDLAERMEALERRVSRLEKAPSAPAQTPSPPLPAPPTDREPDDFDAPPSAPVPSPSVGPKEPEAPVAPEPDRPKTPEHEPVLYGRLASVAVAALISYGLLGSGEYPELEQLIAGFLAWLAADSGISVAVRQLVRPVVKEGGR